MMQRAIEAQELTLSDLRQLFEWPAPWPNRTQIRAAMERHQQAVKFVGEQYRREEQGASKT